MAKRAAFTQSPFISISTTMTSFSISTKSLSSHPSDDERSLDEVYAGTTILRFLCLLNADYTEIESFLMCCPEAIMFERSEESHIQDILLQQMRKCKCFGTSCNANRKEIVRVIRRGFHYYSSVQRASPYESIFMESIERGQRKTFMLQLYAVGRDLRSISKKEEEVERKLKDASSDVNNRRRQLEGVSKLDDSNRSPLSLLQCKKVKVDTVEQRISLEKSFAFATLRISSLEQERSLLAMEHDAAIRLKQALLKNAYAKCRRHVCNAS
jgi:hypothetical protein